MNTIITKDGTQIYFKDWENELECIKAFSETDFHEDLKKFDIPTLIIHGDDDQIVPIATTAMYTAKLVKNATLKV